MGLMAHGIRSTTSLLKMPGTSIPLFLCPLLASRVGSSHDFGGLSPRPHRYRLHIDATAKASQSFPNPSLLLSLPRSCPGCGAFTQTISPGQPGFYGISRKSVKAFIDRDGHCPGNGHKGESKVFGQVLGAADASLLSQMGLQGGEENNTNSQL